jgi:hypothetical protein
MIGTTLVWCGALAVTAPDTTTPEPKIPPAATQPGVPDQAELEKRFQETLTGAVLTGSFTVAGQKSDKPHQPERYTLGKVAKLGGDVWLIQARIQYGERDVNIPVPVRVKWAGDTPVITLTDVSIPGLGTAFSARVLFYRGRYAGTWQHAEHGGHMFGTISRPVEANSAPRPLPPATIEKSPSK